MAEVALASGHHHRHTASISAMDNGTMLRSAPRIEMMPNPEFSFPALPRTSRTPALQPPAAELRRPMSMHSNAPPATQPSLSHRRNHTALPTFSFNAADTSGRTETPTPPLTPELDEAAPVTPKRGHRREGSQLVGGDIRLGAESIISSSPTKSSVPMLTPSYDPPAGRRGHKHRRSGATSISGPINIPTISQPSESEPRSSSSLPNTPLEHPMQPPQPSGVPSLDRSQSAPVVNAEAGDVFGGPLDVDAERPVSRPGRSITFAKEVEIIPRSRPLSTISSETESSMSTVRGHMSHSSINSLLSLNVGTPSPQSNRTVRTAVCSAVEDEPHARRRSSVEISKRIEKEGEWLKSSRSSQSLKRSSAEISTDALAPVPAPSLSFAEPEAPVRQRQTLQKRHPGHATRRRSLPVILTPPEVPAHPLQSISQDNLQDPQRYPGSTLSQPVQRKSSTRKIRDWATSKMSRRSRDLKTLSLDAEKYLGRPRSAGNEPVPGKVPMPEPEPAAETDLDAVFSSQSPGDKARSMSMPSQPRIDVGTPTPSYVSSFHSSQDADDTSAVLDLDSAMEPFNSPSLGSFKPRRELHSSRLNKDFGGPGLHYHRRAESAPELPPFSRGSMASHPSLPDVFEGEGEEEAEASQPARPISSGSEQEEEGGIGIQIVDSDITGAGPGLGWAVDHGLRIQSGEWEMERPSTSHGNVSSRLSTPNNERRPSSIIDQTIIEESSPVEAVRIVESYEEPRASSLTKSSDSSETPTILAPQSETLAVPDGAQSLMTPETYQTSTFSSPDFSRRQGSFDTSRVGTAASSMTDNRTMSSCTGDHGHGVRNSVDDVPSLTSSRSTMMSTMHANASRRDFGSTGSTDRVTSVGSASMDPTVAAERRRKRASIQSLSQLMGGSFSGKSKASDESRPQTADSVIAKAPKKEHRLKKLMFWRSKSRQSLRPPS